MNLSFIIALTILQHSQPHPVAIVSIDRCLSAIDSYDERLVTRRDVENTEAEGRVRLKAANAAEEAIKDDSTEAQRMKAKLLRVEFDLFRLRQQNRLRKAEMKRLNDHLKRIEAAVTTVAMQKECSVVVYQRQQATSVAPDFTARQILMSAPRSLILGHPDGIDITDDVLEKLSATDE
ncbi:MAG: OmpH family outer membrane protein [Fuerstiella sp.]